MRRVFLTLIASMLLLCGCKQNGPHRVSAGRAATAPEIPLNTAVPSPSVQATPAPFLAHTAAATPTAVAAYSPLSTYNEASGLSFIDPLHGWALGQPCLQSTLICHSAIWFTTDGGKSWRNGTARVASGTWQSSEFNPYAANVLFATTHDGWAYGPNLYATHDSGASWTAVAVPGVAVNMSYKDGVLWLLLGQPCSAGNTLPACQPSILESTNLGRTWTPLTSRPSLRDQMPVIVRADRGRAWLITDHVERTGDGGMSWTSLDLPESCRSRVYLRNLGSFAGGTLWLDRALGASAGAEGRGVYTSTDAGSTWTQAFPLMGTPTLLNTSGFSMQLVAVSNRRAFLGLDRYVLEVTDDGGRIWRPAIALVGHAGNGWR